MIEHLIDQIADTIWDIQEDGTIRVFKGNYTQYQNQYEQEQLEQQRQYEQYISENKDCPKPVKLNEIKRNKWHKHHQNKTKSIAPDRLSASKQKARLRRSLKTSKHIEKEWNIWKKLKTTKLS